VAEETYPIANFPQDEFTFRLIDKGEFHSPGDQIWYAVGITTVAVVLELQRGA
jgi:hypothetical protein